MSPLGKIRRGRSQRGDVATINKEWMMQHSHILTPRDVAMLTLLRTFPVMTIRHLWQLTPVTFLKGGRRLSSFYECAKGEQLCRDRVRRLYDYHFVNKFSPRLPLGEGTSVQYIWLDRAGYRFFEMDGRPPKTLSIEYLHHTQILDRYCTLTILERTGVIKMDFLHTCYTAKPVSGNIEPDLIVAFQKNGYGYKYLIEVDTGEKKESDELRKLERYRDWELSGIWIREEWAGIYKKRFPTVMYIFSNDRKGQRRMRIFEEKAKEIGLRGSFLIADTFQGKIEGLGL